jgi:F-type H+-transporting ATPase subunit gamma
MELIATARFKKAMDRAHAATSYTKRITQLVADLANAGLEVSHPLLEAREKTENAKLLMITANRGLCGGYNGSIIRAGFARWGELNEQVPQASLEVSGKRGISACKFRNVTPDETFTHFEDKPTFDEVELLANRYLEAYAAGEIDRLDVAYMSFQSVARQRVVVETLLPLGSLEGTDDAEETPASQSQYEFMPSARDILEEVVPASFKTKLFKCFLDAAVSEQVARMIAMKSATESADDMIRSLSMSYNRARQSQITGEIMEIIGGVEALS